MRSNLNFRVILKVKPNSQKKLMKLLVVIFWKWLQKAQFFFIKIAH